jgi:hypothetical protein
MERFIEAFKVITRVMREGVATHPHNDWLEWPPEYHMHRAEEHLRLFNEGDQQQDHLSHSATRLLMALTLREAAEDPRRIEVHKTKIMAQLAEIHARKQQQDQQPAKKDGCELKK